MRDRLENRGPGKRATVGWIRGGAFAFAFLVAAVTLAHAGESRHDQPAAIAVASGRARFDLPGREKSSKTLVVVSVLASRAGPIPVNLTMTEVPVAKSLAAVPFSMPIPIHSSPAATAVVRLAAHAEPPPPPAHRTFSMMVREGDPVCSANYLPVQGRLAAWGRHAQVYVDARDFDVVSALVVREIVRTFDDEIHPSADRRFGPARDTDGDGRFTILITGWLSRLGGGRLATDGCFRPADLDFQLDPPFGNRCDMMYLSSTLAGGPHLRTVLAHEYAHAVTVSRKAETRAGRPTREEEGWLDESISHLVEDLHGYGRTNLDHRVRAFLSRPEHCRLIIRDYYTADLFRSPGHRGGAYAFVRWCGDQYGVEPFLQRLVRSDQIGVKNLEAATGSTFEDLYRGWTLDLYRGGLETARGEGEPSGPRTDFIDPDQVSLHWEAEGTSTRYIVVETGKWPAARVEIDSAPEAQLQVTTLSLPGDLPRIELAVREERGDPLSLETVVRVALEERDGHAVRLESLSWSGGVLDAAALEPAFAGLTLPAHGRRLSTPLHLKRNAGPVEAFQVIAQDEKGRRVWAWADLKPNAEPH